MVASQDLVLEHGLDAVTVDMICESVGVSARTFFNYFESKIDATLGIGLWQHDPAVEAVFVAGGPTGDLLTDCGELVRAMLDDPPISHDRIGLLMRLARDEPRLAARQLAMFEEHGVELTDLVRRRDGAPARTPQHALTADLIKLFTRTAYAYWDDGGRSGRPSDHLGAILTDLRRVVGH